MLYAHSALELFEWFTATPLTRIIKLTSRAPTPGIQSFRDLSSIIAVVIIAIYGSSKIFLSI
jgi:hypothetical protein